MIVKYMLVFVLTLGCIYTKPESHAIITKRTMVPISYEHDFNLTFCPNIAFNDINCVKNF